MNTFTSSCLAFIGGLFMVAFGDLVSEEVRNRLDGIPFALLRMASRRLPPELRTATYEEEWLPELHFVLRGDQALPITRLIKGTRFAFGLLFTARVIGRDLQGTRGPEETIIKPVALEMEAAGIRIIDMDDIQLLTEIASGVTADVAARRLQTSPAALRRHLRRICDKLNVNTPIEAVTWAARKDLL
jgi:DNA-binding CsgD family transcriptional regulator